MRAPIILLGVVEHLRHIRDGRSVGDHAEVGPGAAALPAHHMAARAIALAVEQASPAAICSGVASLFATWFFDRISATKRAELGIVEAEGRHAARRAVADDRADLGIAQRAQLGAVGERRRAVAADAAGAVAAGTGLFEFRGSSGEIGGGRGLPGNQHGREGSGRRRELRPDRGATMPPAGRRQTLPKARRNAATP